MVNFKIVPVVILLKILIPGIAADNLTCTAIDGKLNNVVWPNTTTKTLSQPPCVDQNKELLYRNCINGEWDTEPQCYDVQSETIPNCPDDFKEVGNMCYILFETTFPPPCPFNNVLPFENWKMSVPNTRPFWMPVTRDLSNGYGVMRWIEPSSSYGTEFSDYVMPVFDNNTNNCVVYQKNYNIAVSCDAKHVGICVYDQDNWITNSTVCSRFHNCVQSNFIDSSTCVCMSTSAEDNYTKKAEFIKFYQNQIYNVLSLYNCTFGLKKSDRKYLWSYSQQEIEYTFWSKDTIFDNNLTYGALTPKGWILTEQPLDCVLYEVEIETPEPHLELKYTDNFEIKVINSNFLRPVKDFYVFCFTNADYLELLYRYDGVSARNVSNSERIFIFDPISNNPGHYWCEAFKLRDTTIIKSNVIFYEPDTEYYEFVSIWEVFYYNTTDPVSKDTIRILDKIFTKICKNDTICNPRIMKMFDLNVTNRNIFVNIHLTCFNTIDLEHHVADKLQAVVISSLIDETGVNFVNFLSAKTCFEEVDNGLCWPTTPLGTETTSYEFCFTRNATRVSRMCQGNFIDGAKWSDYDDCQILDSSLVTDKLLPLYDQNYVNSTTLNTVFDISRDYNQFGALDLYIIAELYKKVQFSEDIVETFVKTINNLLNIKESILIEAQITTKTSKNFLDFISNRLSEEDISIGTKNFVVYSLKKEEIVGVSVTKSNTEKIVNNSVIHNFDSAIILSPELSKLTNDSSKLMFSVFFKSSFFCDTTCNNVSPVFGFFYPLEAFEAPVQIFYQMQSHFVNETCLSWNNSKSIWESTKPRRNESFLICEYWKNGFYSLSFTPVNCDNVTDDLIDILESNASAPVKVDQLSDVSERYESFKPVDVSYAGKILEQVNTEDDIDLHNLAKFVNNMHKIKREFLNESQMTDKATDKILFSLDRIVKNSRNQNIIKIITDNLAILKIDLGLVDFTGAVLTYQHRKLVIRILEGNDTLGQDFDSAVILSPKLKNQLRTEAEIIITIFSNDALFNEQNASATARNAVFGVILPEIGNYSGPVSIIQKVEKNDFDQGCVYWYYNSKTESSHWKRDGINDTFRNFVQCDYWHTTHFALLLIPRDEFNDKTYNYFLLLDTITTINNIVSIASLCCIIFTAILFKQWRSNTGNQILLNFVAVLLLNNIVFYISSSITRFDNNALCTTVGVILHYLNISQFYWMLVIAVLQYKRFVIVFDRPSRYILLKACVFGWVLPLIPVILVFYFDENTYVMDSIEVCYPSGLGLYLGVWLPISIIITVNTVIFLVILYNIINKKAGYMVRNNETMYQLRLAVFLFFMFGLTWLFGLLSAIRGGLIFLYLFTITGTLQGFVLFLFFIVFNPNTRSLYMRAFKKCCTKIK